MTSLKKMATWLSTCYRLDKRYSIGDLLVYSYKGKEEWRVSIATRREVRSVKGDVMCGRLYSADGDICRETLQLCKEGLPLMKVPAGQLFVLGDLIRTTAVDSHCFWNHSYTGPPMAGSGNSPRRQGF